MNEDERELFETLMQRGHDRGLDLGEVEEIAKRSVRLYNDVRADDHEGGVHMRSWLIARMETGDWPAPSQKEEAVAAFHDGVKRGRVARREAEERERHPVQLDLPLEDTVKWEQLAKGFAFRYDLIPQEVLTALAAVFGHGAQKYADRDWEGRDLTERCTEAAYNHLLAHRTDSVNDQESGLPHLAHALTRLAMLVTYQARGREE